MTENEKIDELNLLADNLLGAVQRNVLGTYSPPFDISRPNIHETKKEFLKELNTVLAARDQLNSLFDLLVGSPDKEEVDPSQLAMIEGLKLAVETHTLQRNKATLT